jgi:hypothetical protein
MRLKKIIYTIVFLLIYSPLFALSVDQKRVLDIAYEEGLKIGYPETIQAIVFVESSAGLKKFGDKNKSWSYRSYGIGHFQLATAKWLIKKHFGHPLFKNDKQLVDSLVKNDKFSAILVRIYFEYLLKKFRGNWKKAVLAYNVGPTNVRKKGLTFDPNRYINKINKAIIEVIRQHNKRGNF